MGSGGCEATAWGCPVLALWPFLVSGASALLPDPALRCCAGVWPEPSGWSRGRPSRQAFWDFPEIPGRASLQCPLVKLKPPDFRVWLCRRHTLPWGARLAGTFGPWPEGWRRPVLPSGSRVEVETVVLRRAGPSELLCGLEPRPRPNARHETGRKAVPAP